MTQFIYFMLALIATTLGSLVGLGGGVIIKPGMDFLGHYPITTISVVSSVTVFSMAITATIRQVRNGFKISKSLILLALGSTVGGIIGKILFTKFIAGIDGSTASGIQGLILAAILVVVLFRDKLPDYDIKNKYVIAFIGMSLGCIAAFLGIGGGPINVMVLMMFLKMDIKDAANGSIVVILLSQFSKLASVTIEGGLMVPGIGIVLFMIPAAIAGGLIGSKFQHIFSGAVLQKLFNVVLVLLIALNIYNASNFLGFI